MVRQVQSLELGTNVLAAHVAAGRSRDVSEVMAAMRMGPHEGFEAAFNLGCAQLATGQLDAAHDQLLHAQRLGLLAGFLHCMFTLRKQAVMGNHNLCHLDIYASSQRSSFKSDRQGSHLCLA